MATRSLRPRPSACSCSAAALICRRSAPCESAARSGARTAGASSAPAARRSMIDEASDNADLEIADALDMALEHVAALHRTDARRRARHDDVAGRKLEQAGEVADHLGHLPDHLVE